MKKGPIWMPHAGHFIGGHQCEFRLNTYVNGYIVSTVGELKHPYKPEGSWMDIGFGRKYETMVFLAKESPKTPCCPYRQASGLDIDSEGYNDPGAAYRGHLAMVAKFQKRRGKK
jgi:hypothetical protein